MKKYWVLVFGLIILIGGIIYMANYHRRWLKKYYLVFKTKDLVFNSENLNKNLNYRLLAPKKHISGQIPLVLILHGAGSRGNNNTWQLGSLSYEFMRNKSQNSDPCFVIAPQCPKGSEWVNRSNPPFTHYLQDETSESLEMKLILELIKELVTKYPIDINRIYVAGFSMGGTGAWDIITRYPDVFASAAIFAGYSDTTKANLITQIPVWAFSGENDNIAPAKLNEEMCEAVNSFGGISKFTKFENIGHDCVQPAFEQTDILKWLFSNKKNESKNGSMNDL